ncbi:MAG: GTP-binding protein, partial [Methylococcaceae bacterium]
AEVIPMVMGQVPLPKILNTNLFDFEQAQQAPGWLQELRGSHTPETEEYGISSFNYLARRPFHPTRFYEYLHFSDWDNGTLLRSKGFFWLASRPEWVGSWSQAGGTMQHGCQGRWWTSIPRDEWPEEYVAEIESHWQAPFGDCRQELVFIGQNMDSERTRRELDACLLTDVELAQGEAAWRHYEDEFPEWFSDEAN